MRKKQHTISVIIPCFNAEISLGRCLASVLAQTQPPDEIIVIDDGSTDNSYKAIDPYKERITYVRQDNRGQGAARNSGLEIASAEYITFLDADDYWLPEFCEKCVAYLSIYPDVVAVSTAQIIKHWGTTLRINPSFITSESITRPFVIDRFFTFWSEHDHIMTGSVMMRGSVVSQAGGQLPDLRISQDLEYWGYLATFGKWAMIPEPLFVTDGMQTAATMGWWRKYQTRWQLCPSVVQWERRLVQRIPGIERDAFHRLRGKIALTFANAMLLSGRYVEARQTVIEYGACFPPHGLSRLLQTAARTGRVGWRFGCYLLSIRRWFGTVLVTMRSKVSSRTKHRP